MSSDSEDDFYDNVTERLQKEMDKFQEDRIETANLLDDSADLDEIVKNNKLPPKSKRKSTPKSSEETAGSSVSDLPSVSVDNTGKTASKRMTRSRAKIDNIEVPTDLEPPVSKRQRSSTTSEANPDNPGTSRGRGRGRGRGTRTPKRGRRSRGSRYERQNIISDFMAALIAASGQVNPWDPSIPTYSVGNTSEYPDESHGQALFSSSSKQKTDDVVVIEEENLDDDNEELSVKVYWQSSEFFKFTLRRFQKLTQIFEYFSKKENVTHDKLLFTYNEKILTPDDTPDAIDYKIVKFIDGGIVSQGVKDLLKRDKENIKDGIKIKFQCQNMKKPLEIMIKPDDKLSLAMMQCSEHLEKPLDKVKFEFDGDIITGKATARELEFEGGECIDVKILS